MKGRVAALALLFVLAVPGRAAAVPPQDITGSQHRVVEAFVPECGFTVRWTIDLTFHGKNFFDQEGTLIRQQLHVTEDNTIENVESGLVLREGPDHFTQILEFNPNGTIATLTANGLAVNVQGDERLKDVGHFVAAFVPGVGFVPVASGGPHPVREATSGPLVQALKAFCDVLD
ncbi:MAG TPA: hypothetical protein VHH92_00555 [Actinomycetota bacterium]|nr:hypothetical protein [Actinomycetota bacterium]